MEHTNVLVSCIITTYNRPKLVGRAIESVLGQSYSSIELIIIDDHSNELYDEVKELYSANVKVRFHRNAKNLGLAASRNVGINLSNGKYVAFLDDDDVWMKDKLKKQISYLETNKDFIGCSSSHIESVSKKTIKIDKEVYRFEDNTGFNYLGPPSKLMLKKDIALATMFDEEAKHAEDWDFYLRILKLGPVYIFKDPLIIYDTVHFGRMTTGFSSMTIAQIKEKAQMTYKNRTLIGERNFKMRLGEYFLTGIFRRKNIPSYFQQVIKEVGLATVVRVFKNKVKRSLAR